MRHPHRFPWAHIARKQVLARERTGPFSSHGSFCLVKVNGRAIRLREARVGTINYWTRFMKLLMS